MASQSNDDQDLDLPKIPHERIERAGEPGSHLKKAHIERKGIRYHRRNEYYDPRLGLEDRSMTGDDPTFIWDWLRKRANDVLRSSGELDYFQVLETVEDAKAPTAVEGMDAGLMALFVHYAQIVERHGYLAREANAARFLALNDRVSAIIGSDIEKWEVMMEWADAWYWLRLEESAAHYLAVEGAKAMAGRATSASKRSERRRVKLQIIGQELSAYRERQKKAGRQVNLTAAAGDILEAVNSRLAQLDWEPYTEASLRTLLSQASKPKR